jgi:cytoskeleton protein RodZ
LNASFRTGGQSFGTDLMVHLTKPMAIAILALCLGILAIVFIPTRNTAEIEPDSVSTVQKAPILKVAPAASIDQPPMPLQSASVPQATASESVTIVESNSVAGVLALQAQGASWVEVTDAKGFLQLRKTLYKGEIVQVSGVLPLSVVLGRADLVGVSVRGQALDVMSLAKDNVARFEVK